MSDTISSDSNIGKRLNKISKTETLRLSYQGKFYALASQMIIGRDPSCQIYIQDSLISRNHAMVQKIKEAYFVTDMNSRNGTWLNGEQIEPGRYYKLHKNDKLKLGRTELIIF